MHCSCLSSLNHLTLLWILLSLFFLFYFLFYFLFHFLFYFLFHFLFYFQVHFVELVGSDIASAFAITKPPNSWEDMSRMIFLRGEDNERINNEGNYDSKDNNRINNNGELNFSLKVVELETDTPYDNTGLLVI